MVRTPTLDGVPWAARGAKLIGSYIEADFHGSVVDGATHATYS